MKTSPSPSSDNDLGFWQWLKRSAAPVGSLIGAVMLVYQIIQLWRGDQDTATWLLAGTGAVLVFAGLYYVAFSKIIHERKIYLEWAGGNLRSNWEEPRFPKIQKAARWGLVVYFLSIIGIGVYLWEYGKTLDAKTIILLTQFDGPDPQGYRVTDIIYNALADELASYEDTKIILLDDSVSEVNGKEKAIQIGKRYHADLILWGWYGVTKSDARLTLHVENLESVS